MKIKEGVVSTMPELLKRMARNWGSRKTGAVLHSIRSTPPEVYIKEYFDSGKGASNALWAERKDVAPELFDRALREGFVAAKPQWGGVSQWEFVITDAGEQAHAKNEQIAEVALKNLYPSRGVRVRDLQPHLREFSEEAIEEVLGELVRRGRVQPPYSYAQGEPKFYLLARRCAA